MIPNWPFTGSPVKPTGRLPSELVTPPSPTSGFTPLSAPGCVVLELPPVLFLQPVNPNAATTTVKTICTKNLFLIRGLLLVTICFFASVTYGPHAGSDAPPSIAGNCTCSPVTTSSRYNCVRQCCVFPNTRCRPSGAHDGSSLSAPSDTMGVTAPVPRSYTPN